MRKGRQRSTSSLRRRYMPIQEQRSGALTLIVCEDSVASPAYLNHCKLEWRSTGVEIHGEQCGASPRTVVEYATRVKKERVRKARRGGPPVYDQVWCVFDRDQHANIHQAVNMAKDNGIRIALSTPCFEVWLILHFEYTTRLFHDCTEVIRRLNGHLGTLYDKRAMPMDELFPVLDTAMIHAGRLRANNEATATDNPLTDVDKLIDEIRR